jgi:hemin uptake protein HemP
MAREACADPDTPDSDTPADTPREVESRTLFGGARVVTIRHGDDLYTLRITRAEKLILTK